MAERPIKAERKNTDMTVGVLKTLGTFLVFLLVQVLVLNHVHLFDSATPLLYIYMVLLFPRNYPKWGMLVWAFALGIGVDMFSNTPGVAAASLTLVALLRPYLLELFIQRESAEDLVPSIKVLGFAIFVFCLHQHLHLLLAFLLFRSLLVLQLAAVGSLRGWQHVAHAGVGDGARQP